MRHALLAVAMLAAVTTQAFGQITNGLLSHWKLDGAPWSDSINGLNLDQYGDVAVIPGEFGNAVLIDALAAPNRLSRDGSAYSLGNHDITIAVWYNAQDLSLTSQALIANGNADLTIIDWGFIRAQDGSISFVRQQLPVVFASAPQSGWHLAVGTYRKGDGLYVWIDNGPPSFQSTVAIRKKGLPVLLSGTTLNMGLSWVFASAWGNPSNVALDSVSVWNRPLTDSERASLFSGTSGLD